MHRQHEHSTPDHLQAQGTSPLTDQIPTHSGDSSNKSFFPEFSSPSPHRSGFQFCLRDSFRFNRSVSRLFSTPPCMGLAHVPEYRGVPTPTESRTPTESAQPQSVPHRAHSAKTHPQSIMHCKGIRVPTCPAREYPAGPASIPRCRSEPTPRVLSCIFLHHNKGPRSHTAKERCEAKQQIHHNKNHCRNSSPP